MSAINPIEDPESWDFILIGGVKSPGLADVSGAGLHNAFDIKKGKGIRGATLTYTGEDPAEFKVTLRFWEPEHFAAWDDFRALLKYDPTKKTVQAIEIYHPALEDVGVTSVVTNHIGQLVKISTGYFSVEVSFIQYKKPGKGNATGTPTGSTSGAGGKSTPGTSVPSAVDAQQAELARLLEEARKP